MNIKKFDLFNINESITEDEKFLINGSELFHWQSRVRDEEKLRILNWYKSLSQKERDDIDILRENSYSEGYESGANDPSL